MKKRQALFCLALIAALSVCSCFSEDKSTGEWAINIVLPNGISRVFTSEDASSLEQYSIDMTIEHMGSEDEFYSFTGVTASDTVEALGAGRFSRVFVTSYEGYRKEIDHSLFLSDTTLLAFKQGGQFLDGGIRLCPKGAQSNLFIRNISTIELINDDIENN